MTNLRRSEADGVPVWHRPPTILLPPERCYRGHQVPRYSSGDCVICVRLRTKRNKGSNALQRPRKNRPQNRMVRFTDYGDARQEHEERGGWLLDLGGGVYGVTDNLNTVRVRRGAAWLKQCDRLGCWDEVELQPRQLRAA